MTTENDLRGLVAEEPAEAARRIVDAAGRAGHRTWVSDFAGVLGRLAERDALDRILDVWGLSDAEAGRMFRVSRQAIGKWRARGLPDSRRIALAELAATTDLLTHYLKADRVPAAVRHGAAAFDGSSMVQLVSEGRTAEVLTGVRDLFDLRRLDAG